MAELIPDQWKNEVRSILAEASNGSIIVKKRAAEEFQAMFPLSFSFHLYQAFEQALKTSGLTGNQISGMTPEGTTYEFIFSYERRNVYGKVCLTTDNKVIVIFSAHRPLKGTTL